MPDMKGITVKIPADLHANPWAAGPCRRVTSARGKTTGPSPCR